MVAAFSALNVLFTICWHYALRRIHPLKTLDALKDIIPFALIATVCMMITRYATLWTDTLWLLFTIRIILVTLLYLGILKLLHAQTLEECINFLFKKNKRQ